MRYVRDPEVTSDEVDGRAVLLDATGATLITLNPTGTLVWARLAEPATVDDLVDAVAVAAPEVTRSTVAHDVEHFLAELSQRALVRPAADG
jgi:hypothetical protein